jgi:dynactin 1
MMDLNRQLQASAMSTKVKTIEMELRKMEAQEASEHLAIVQLFLPEAFHAERDSVLALLRFKRISFKSRLLHAFLKERVTSPGLHAHLDHLLAGCDAMDKLTWISAMCDRFTNSISTSSLKQFARFESALYELEPVERTLNGYIENLRKDELREQQVAEGLQRSIAVMKHLSELHLREGVESYVEEVLMNMLLTQSHLETTASSMVLTKNELLKVIPASEDGDDEMSVFADKVDGLAMQSRGAKIIVGKILRSLQELKTQNLGLSMETQPNIEACEATTNEFAYSLRTLGTSLHEAINDEARVSSFGLADLLFTVREFNASQFNATDSDVFAPLQANLKALHQRLSDVYTVASDLSNTVEFEHSDPPWVLRSKELQSSKIISADAEQEISNLKRELNERGTTIKLRDQTLEEAELRIELLDGKMRDVQKKAKQITELEKTNDTLHANERKLQEKNEKLTQLNARLEEERDRWMRNASELKNKDSSASDLKRAGAEMIGTSAQMESLKQDINVLESTCRYLRQQARRSQIEEAARNTSWLQQPLLPKKNNEALQLRKDSMQALENLAKLPTTAKPVPVIDAREKKDRLKWKPMASSLQYQLAEAEMHWLNTWEPVGIIKGPWAGGFGHLEAGDAVTVV